LEVKQVKTEKIGSKRADHYANWSEFVAAAAGDPGTDIRSPASRFTTRPIWSGSPTYESGLALAREGWRDGAERVRAMAASIGGRVEARMMRKVARFSHRRGMLVASRLQQGNPKPFVRMVEREMADRNGRRVVRVVVNGAASDGIEPEVIETRGAAVTALVDALERAGRRVELDLVVGIRNPDIETWVRIKGAGDRLHLENVAYALAHPSTLRRLMFAVWEKLPAADRRYLEVGYGTPNEVAEADRGDLYLGRMLLGEPQWLTAEAATRWVIETLSAQGIKIETAAA
jgi:hypothetical protein